MNCDIRAAKSRTTASKLSNAALRERVKLIKSGQRKATNPDLKEISKRLGTKPVKRAPAGRPGTKRKTIKRKTVKREPIGAGRPGTKRKSAVGMVVKKSKRAPRPRGAGGKFMSTRATPPKRPERPPVDRSTKPNITPRQAIRRSRGKSMYKPKRSVPMGPREPEYNIT